MKYKINWRVVLTVDHQGHELHHREIYMLRHRVVLNQNLSYLRLLVFEYLPDHLTMLLIQLRLFARDLHFDDARL